jgi:SAM-dependent methyltransferase
MRVLDRVLQQWRAAKARPYITAGARVLDIGCHRGEFLISLGDHIGPSIGFDPLARDTSDARHQFIADFFRQPSSFDDESFDAVVLLATLEHIPNKEPLAEELFRLLSPGGRVIITVPSRAVDGIVEWLCRLGLADGMSLDEHHGYDPLATPDVFGWHGFVLERHRRFQFGLNHLFVLRKPVHSQLRRRPELVGGSVCA